MNRCVLDSYAVLAYLHREAGWERVKELLKTAAEGHAELHMSLVNLAEVQYVLIRRRKDLSSRLAALESLPISVESADAYVPQVVEIKARYPISLADCFAAALARDLDCPVVTGDPEFRKLESIVKIDWL